MIRSAPVMLSSMIFVSLKMGVWMVVSIHLHVHGILNSSKRPGMISLDDSNRMAPPLEVVKVYGSIESLELGILGHYGCRLI